MAIHNIDKLQPWEALLKKIVFTQLGNIKGKRILDFGSGFHVIIMTVANSLVNIRVLDLLPKFKTRKFNRWCTV